MIFEQVDEYGDRLTVYQFNNGNYLFEANLDVINELKPDQALRLADAIYARESERFKESL